MIAILAFLVGSLTTARLTAWLPRQKEAGHRIAELDARLRAVEYACRTRPVLPPPTRGRGW
ncbi:hypothetical protein AB0L41_18350 [Amycolatopsis mediterranei]|uniref:hypothetical protein n=1 Tax=Amycolatopsis mediterranei TaxID=33910 RepID=UPI0034288277